MPHPDFPTLFARYGQALEAEAAAAIRCAMMLGNALRMRRALLGYTGRHIALASGAIDTCEFEYTVPAPGGLATTAALISVLSFNTSALHDDVSTFKEAVVALNSTYEHIRSLNGYVARKLLHTISKQWLLHPGRAQAEAWKRVLKSWAKMNPGVIEVVG